MEQDPEKPQLYIIRGYHNVEEEKEELEAAIRRHPSGSIGKVIPLPKVEVEPSPESPPEEPLA